MNAPLHPPSGPRSPLGRVVASTPMMAASFALLRTTWWTEDGWIVAHEAELPEQLRQDLVAWANLQFGRRMKR